MSYSVSGIKSFIGREGHGFNAYLHHDGRKIAFVTDHANGGCLSFDWLAKDRDVAMADAKALEAHCKTLPQIDCGPLIVNGCDVMLDADRDTFVTDLVSAVEVRRAMTASLKRLLSKRVMFVLDGTMKQTTVLRAITPEIRARVTATNPTATILNTMAFDDALALYVKHCA